MPILLLRNPILWLGIFGGSGLFGFWLNCRRLRSCRSGGSLLRLNGLRIRNKCRCHRDARARPSCARCGDGLRVTTIVIEATRGKCRRRKGETALQAVLGTLQEGSVGRTRQEIDGGLE